MLARCIVVLAVVVMGCGSDGGDAGDDTLGGSLRVTGAVVDFQTGAAVDGAASVSTSGLLPVPRITAQGPAFTIEGIPENSAFQVLASAPPTHHATFSQAVIVTSTDLDGVKALVVDETFLAGLATAFGVTPSAANGMLFIHLVDSTGAPKAGVAASNLVISGANGPHFLDANLMAAPAATSSSASGWAVFFEVPAGVVSLGQAAAPTQTLDMATSPINAGTITLADAKVSDGAPALPTNVSFANQIFPLFSGRGCVACHSGGGIGKDLGGLTLDGSANLVYKELVQERPNTRVKLATPEASLVLTMPSREDPPDGHPNVTFTSAQDPDYLKLLVWIREGAKDN
jgi:hypothetical protein